MPRALTAAQILTRARAALAKARLIDPTALRGGARTGAILRKRAALLEATRYARRCIGEPGFVPPRNRPTAAQVVAARRILEEAEALWPDPNTLEWR